MILKVEDALKPFRRADPDCSQSNAFSHRDAYGRQKHVGISEGHIPCPSGQAGIIPTFQYSKITMDYPEEPKMLLLL